MDLNIVAFTIITILNLIDWWLNASMRRDSLKEGRYSLATYHSVGVLTNIVIQIYLISLV